MLILFQHIFQTIYCVIHLAVVFSILLLHSRDGLTQIRMRECNNTFAIKHKFVHIQTRNDRKRRKCRRYLTSVWRPHVIIGTNKLEQLGKKRNRRFSASESKWLPSFWIMFPPVFCDLWNRAKSKFIGYLPEKIIWGSKTKETVLRFCEVRGIDSNEELIEIRRRYQRLQKSSDIDCGTPSDGLLPQLIPTYSEGIRTATAPEIN